MFKPSTKNSVNTYVLENGLTSEDEINPSNTNGEAIYIKSKGSIAATEINAGDFRQIHIEPNQTKNYAGYIIYDLKILKTTESNGNKLAVPIDVTNDVLKNLETNPIDLDKNPNYFNEHHVESLDITLKDIHACYEVKTPFRTKQTIYAKIVSNGKTGTSGDTGVNGGTINGKTHSEVEVDNTYNVLRGDNKSMQIVADTENGYVINTIKVTKHGK